MRKYEPGDPHPIPDGGRDRGVAMRRWLAGLVVFLALLSPLAAAIEAQQRNGEAYSTTPEVVRDTYDMRAAMAAIPLSETELKGRALFAQRCANCHGGTRQRPGPLLGKQTVE